MDLPKTVGEMKKLTTPELRTLLTQCESGVAGAAYLYRNADRSNHNARASAHQLAVNRVNMLKEELTKRINAEEDKREARKEAMQEPKIMGWLTLQPRFPKRNYGR